MPEVQARLRRIAGLLRHCGHPISAHLPGFSFGDGGRATLDCTECDAVCPVPPALVKGQGAGTRTLSVRDWQRLPDRLNSYAPGSSAHHADRTGMTGGVNLSPIMSSYLRVK